MLSPHLHLILHKKELALRITVCRFIPQGAQRRTHEAMSIPAKSSFLQRQRVHHSHFRAPWPKASCAPLPPRIVAFEEGEVCARFKKLDIFASSLIRLSAGRTDSGEIEPGSWHRQP